MSFNIFKILEKDNKELIHSAFISYLLDHNKNFRKKFIHETIENFKNSELEKSYSDKKIKIRIDVQIQNVEGNFIAIIENKFKSFPTGKQLNDYNKVFKSKFDKSMELKKVLFCFDKNTVKFETDWEILDYKDLLDFLKKEYISNNDDDEITFVRHYISFLEEYIENYKNLKSNCNHLFKSNLNKDQKFWLRLLNFQIANDFEKEFSDNQFEFNINPGNTSTPLLNIIPKHWKSKTNEEILIQFQGNDLKFYLHSKNKESANKLISYSTDKVWSNNIEIKKQTQRNQNSCFIFKTKLTDNLENDFKYDELFKLIADFYINIDQIIINNYSLLPQ